MTTATQENKGIGLKQCCHTIFALLSKKGYFYKKILTHHIEKRKDKERNCHIYINIARDEVPFPYLLKV